MSTAQHDRFTATGGPRPSYSVPSALERSCPWGLQAPILPPFRFTDETIIPVMVRIEEEQDWYVDEKVVPRLRQHANIFSQLVEQLIYFSTTISNSGADTDYVCAFMPRREYLKHFARDEYGVYIGTEAPRTWSVGELQATFGKYRSARRERWVLCEEDGGFVCSEEITGYSDEKRKMDN